ncbi:MAG TPA: methionyl-tRNA formyltransferase [Thermoanaerobaculia bacterium]|nr:methionyl-tRNA formyltransferase [Thermoanaerobaculia bacterium]
MNGPIERIVFFGTPEFAVPTLDALAAAGRAPLLVVSQPARPSGRGKRTEQPPVARWAEQHRVSLEQPARVRDPDFLARLRDLAPDLAVVVAFGQIFRPELLQLPRLGCVNLHGSLLPRHRGAAPVQAALLAGDAITGVTTMLMDEGLDTGPILLQREAPIEPNENAGDLQARLAVIGAELVVETVERLAAGTLVPLAQRGELATLAPRLRKEDGRIAWSSPAPRLAALVRAMTPWPGAFTELRGEPLRVVEARPLRAAEAPAGAAAPGSVLGRSGEGFAVRSGDGGALLLLRVQRPGRRAVSALDFWNGERIAPGDVCDGGRVARDTDGARVGGRG